MRHLISCLLALTSAAGILGTSASAQSAAPLVGTEAEPDGTLLSASLGLPYNLLNLPLIGNQPQPVALVKPAVTKPVVSSKPVVTKPVTSSKPVVTKPVVAKPLISKPSTSKPPTSKPPTSKPPTSKPLTSKPVAPKPVIATAPRNGPSYVLKSTAYNSLSSQTDRTPFITATGARTRFGVIALSRDMLRNVPYGSLVRIEDWGAWGSGRGRGTYNRLLSGVLFQVEDTMHPRKVRTVDVWFYSRSQALQWGARQVKLTIIRRGR
jgi:3D (Asp-Asp-Asp) domain-containing protein